MPGLMDTVLNVGMNDEVAQALASKAGERFAWDSYRRFLGMFGILVLGMASSVFEQELELVEVHACQCNHSEQDCVTASHFH